jgi:hypothetical protein
MASSNYPYSSSAPSIISLSNIVDKELLENSHISFAGVEKKMAILWQLVEECCLCWNWRYY